jgi:hypothetical protein
VKSTPKINNLILLHLKIAHMSKKGEFRLAVVVPLALWIRVGWVQWKGERAF